MSKSEKFMLHIYAFTIMIMFIVLCGVARRCQGNSNADATVARRRRCFPMQRGVRRFVALVSLLSFFLERGSLSRVVVASEKRLFFCYLISFWWNPWRQVHRVGLFWRNCLIALRGLRTSTEGLPNHYSHCGLFMCGVYCRSGKKAKRKKLRAA